MYLYINIIVLKYIRNVVRNIMRPLYFPVFNKEFLKWNIEFAKTYGERLNEAMLQFHRINIFVVKYILIFILSY